MAICKVRLSTLLLDTGYCPKHSWGLTLASTEHSEQWQLDRHRGVESGVAVIHDVAVGPHLGTVVGIALGVGPELEPDWLLGPELGKGQRLGLDSVHRFCAQDVRADLLLRAAMGVPHIAGHWHRRPSTALCPGL